MTSRLPQHRWERAGGDVGMCKGVCSVCIRICCDFKAASAQVGKARGRCWDV